MRIILTALTFTALLLAKDNFIYDTDPTAVERLTQRIITLETTLAALQADLAGKESQAIRTRRARDVNTSGEETLTDPRLELAQSNQAAIRKLSKALASLDTQLSALQTQEAALQKSIDALEARPEPVTPMPKTMVTAAPEPENMAKLEAKLIKKVTSLAVTKEDLNHHSMQLELLKERTNTMEKELAYLITTTQGGAMTSEPGTFGILKNIRYVEYFVIATAGLFFLMFIMIVGQAGRIRSLNHKVQKLIAYQSSIRNSDDRK